MQKYSDHVGKMIAAGIPIEPPKPDFDLNEDVKQQEKPKASKNRKAKAKAKGKGKGKGKGKASKAKAKPNKAKEVEELDVIRTVKAGRYTYVDALDDNYKQLAPEIRDGISKCL